jgi:protein tyrosine phosphatase
LPRNSALLLFCYKSRYKQIMKSDDTLVKTEFLNLSALTEQTSQSKSASLYYNRHKNRYGDVLPNEDTQVRLSHLEGVTGSDYINANFVRGETPSSSCFICGQAPLPQTFEDFWRMVWEQEVPVIVVLMRLKENGRVKGHMYWPGILKETKQYGNIKVTLKMAFFFSSIKIRIFNIEHVRTLKEREVVQLHYKGWPDFGVPETTRPIRELVHLMNAFRQSAAEKGIAGPAFVHCSAGIGRTGTFITISLAFEKLMQQNLLYRFNKENKQQTDFQTVFMDAENSNVSSSSSSSTPSSLNTTTSSSYYSSSSSTASSLSSSSFLVDSHYIDQFTNRCTSPCSNTHSQNSLNSKSLSCGSSLENGANSNCKSSGDNEISTRLPLSRCVCNLPIGVNVMDIVLSLRRQRNRGMVQTEEQYLFIHQTILDELNEGAPCLSPTTRVHVLEQTHLVPNSLSPRTTLPLKSLDEHNKVNNNNDDNDNEICCPYSDNHQKAIDTDSDNDVNRDTENVVQSESMDTTPPPSSTSPPSSPVLETKLVSSSGRVLRSEGDINHRALKLRRTRTKRHSPREKKRAALTSSCAQAYTLSGSSSSSTLSSHSLKRASLAHSQEYEFPLESPFV